MYPFAELLERVQGVNLKTSTIEPEGGEVGKGEVVLGVLPDNLKKLYVASVEFTNDLRKRCNELHPEMERLGTKYADRQLLEDGTPEGLDDKDLLLVQTHNLNHEKRKLFMSHFWLAVKAHFAGKHLRDYNVGLREGWKVVTYYDSVGVARTMSDLFAQLIPQE